MEIKTPKKTYEVSWSDETTKWEETFGGRFAQPALEFVIRTAEIVLVAGAFQVAAHATILLSVRFPT